MSIPKVILLNADRSTLSDESGFSNTNLEIKFDIPITEFKVKVMGVSHDTGTLAHREAKDIENLRNQNVSDIKITQLKYLNQFINEQSIQEISMKLVSELIDKSILSIYGNSGSLNAIVDYLELYQEGNNQVNVYGKSIDTGEWTIKE